MTESERRFEEYCAHRGYRFERIVLPANEGRRPDYRLHLPAGEVIVEVKQIEPGPWEKQIDERMEKHGRAETSRAIGKRARDMIRDAAPQLRKHKADGLPCVIFALDLTWHTHLSDVDIDAAMFGQPLVRFHPDGKPADDWRSDFGHGGGRQMTEDDRVYVSAVCVMDRRELRLSIYHNPFAAQPLFPRYFAESGDQHFIKDGHPEKSGHLWLEYVGPRE